jgi:sterol desaturase/sphingolipid hydroxylase (fatty acid hydroxylase superfamily)
MAVLEQIAPMRPLAGRGRRWTTNMALTMSSTLLLRIVAPLGAVGAALWATTTGFGLFNQFTVPLVISVPLSLLALDALIYGQHVAFHRIGFFWRMHKVHHADTALDVTTGFRFHPFEIIVSLAVKITAIAALGAPPVAVLLFEVLLNATSMFNHANLELPPRLDRALRRVIVTPDMHRVHHSIIIDEQNRNFGFNLSLWDRVFRTYHVAERGALTKMRIGLAEHLDKNPCRFFWSLILPFHPSPAPAERQKKSNT